MVTRIFVPPPPPPPPPKPKPQPVQPPPRRPAAPAVVRPAVSEFSTGRGSALRTQALRTIGAAPAQAAVIADANAYYATVTFSDETPQGSTAAQAIAENALSGETATGTDGDLNCVEAAVDCQERFAAQGVNSEIVVVGDHAVLRLDDGTYYDPTNQRLLTSEEAKPFEGVDGITVAEREYLEDQARAGAAGAGPNATPEQQLAAATNAVTEAASARGIDEPSATELANDVSYEDAYARAEEARAKVGTDPATAEADAAAALELMRAANEVARNAGLEPPYPLADGVTDGNAAARLNAEQQTELFGRPLGTDPAAQVEEDIASLPADDPAQAAIQLDQLLANASPEYRALLLGDPRVQAMLQALPTQQGDPEHVAEGAAALVRLTERLGADAAWLISVPLALGYEWPTSMENGFQAGLTTATHTSPMEYSSGVTLAIALTNSMAAHGQHPQAIDEMRTLVTTSLNELQQQLDATAREVEDVQAQLAWFISELDPALSDAEREQAIQAFMQQHAELFARYERLGAVAVGAAGAFQSLGEDRAAEIGLGQQNLALAKSMPAIGGTRAGAEFLQSAVAKAAAGQPSYLDYLLKIGATDNEWMQKMALHVFTAVGNQAADLMMKGDYASAQWLVSPDGPMRRFAPLLGLDDAQFAKVFQGLTEITVADPTNYRAAWDRALKNLQEAGLDTRLMQIVGGVATALGIISFARNPSFGAGDNGLDVLADMAEKAGIGVDGFSLGVKLLGRALGRPGVTAAGKALEEVAGKFVMKLGIGIDAFRMMRAFWRGDVRGTAAYGLSAVGGALILAGGPVGWLVGGSMVIASVILQLKMGADAERVKALKQFLVSAGLEEEVAQRLAEAPEGRLRELEAMGFTDADLVAMAREGSLLLTDRVSSERLQQLRALGLTGEQIEELAVLYPALVTGDAPLGKFTAMAQALGLSGDDVLQLLEALGPDGYLRFFDTLEGQLPDGEGTREDWLALLQQIVVAAEGGDVNADAMDEGAAFLLQLTAAT